VISGKKMKEMKSWLAIRLFHRYIPYMTTTLFTNGRSQAVRIPKELRLEGSEVSIRRLGDGVFVVPVKASAWPEGFFENIRIEDDQFTRPDQGDLPPIVEFTE
jgi:antitoxin VapB